MPTKDLLQVDKHSTICENLGPCHIPAQFITSQEHGRARHILGFPDAAHGNAVFQIGSLLLVLHVVVCELGVDGARKDRVASDPVLGQRDGHGLYHGRDGSLRRRVVHLQAAADQCRDGGDAYDATASTLLDHLPCRRLARVEGSVDVDVHRVVKKVLFNAVACLDRTIDLQYEGEEKG